MVKNFAYTLYERFKMADWFVHGMLTQKEYEDYIKANKKEDKNKGMEKRIKNLKRMDKMVRNFNDEDLIMDWLIAGVPDEASEDDYEFIASDINEYNRICAVFVRLWFEEMS